MFIIKFVPFLYTSIDPFVHVMAPNYSDFTPKRYRCKADSLDSILDVVQVSSFETLIVFWKTSKRQRRAIAHDRLFRVAFVLLSHCCELRNLQQKKNLEKKLSSACERERVTFRYPGCQRWKQASLRAQNVRIERIGCSQIICDGSVML